MRAREIRAARGGRCATATGDTRRRAPRGSVKRARSALLVRAFGITGATAGRSCSRGSVSGALRFSAAQFALRRGAGPAPGGPRARGRGAS